MACSEADNGNPHLESDRDAFVQDAVDRIAELRTELNRMRDDIADGTAAEEVEQQADRLGERIDEAESELEQVRSAGDDEWTALQDSLEKSLQDAGDLAGEISSELGLD
jgi:hypothetical protein